MSTHDGINEILVLLPLLSKTSSMSWQIKQKHFTEVTRLPTSKLLIFIPWFQLKFYFNILNCGKKANLLAETEKYIWTLYKIIYCTPLDSTNFTPALYVGVVHKGDENFKTCGMAGLGTFYFPSNCKYSYFFLFFFFSWSFSTSKRGRGKVCEVILMCTKNNTIDFKFHLIVIITLV